MTVKPWQKATLSVFAGATVYAGFLDAFTMQVQKHNQTVSEQRSTITEQEKSLEALFAAKKKTLVSLEAKLNTEKENTAKVDSEIKAVNTEISQIKAGHIPGATLATVPVSSVPKTTLSVANIQPPPVQAVTTASGG